MNVEGDEAFKHIVLLVDDSDLIRFPGGKGTSKCIKICKKTELVKCSISQVFKAKTRKLQCI
jgi:hypothetical protein